MQLRKGAGKDINSSCGGRVKSTQMTHTNNKAKHIVQLFNARASPLSRSYKLQT